jgi:hypothetical protein
LIAGILYLIKITIEEDRRNLAVCGQGSGEIHVKHETTLLAKFEGGMNEGAEK